MPVSLFRLKSFIFICDKLEVSGAKSTGEAVNNSIDEFWTTLRANLKEFVLREITGFSMFRELNQLKKISSVCFAALFIVHLYLESFFTDISLSKIGCDEDAKIRNLSVLKWIKSKLLKFSKAS